MTEAEKAGVETQFKEALQVLALNAEDQVACTEPGDVPVEVIEDYLSWANSYINCFQKELNWEAIDKIEELRGLIEELPDSRFKDSNIESMNDYHWNPVREKARILLNVLGCPLESPPSFKGLGNGVYRRK